MSAETGEVKGSREPRENWDGVPLSLYYGLGSLGLLYIVKSGMNLSHSSNILGCAGCNAVLHITSSKCHFILIGTYRRVKPHWYANTVMVTCFRPWEVSSRTSFSIGPMLCKGVRSLRKCERQSRLWQEPDLRGHFPVCTSKRPSLALHLQGT